MCSQNRVRDSGGFNRSLHVVRSQDVRSVQDQRGLSGQCAVEPQFGRGVFVASSQRSANERLSRSSSEQRKSGGLQLVEASNQRIVLFEVFAEPKPGIEYDSFPPH